MADLVIQRVVMPPERQLARLYCRFAPGSGGRGRRSVVLPGGTCLRTDTYFNGFFEGYWRKYTRLGRLDLRVRVSGAGTLRLYRRSPGGGRGLLRQVTFAGKDREVSLEAPPAETGLLYFEVRARSRRLLLHRAEWVARDVEARPARLVAGYCTFNREPLLIRNVAALLKDPDVAAALSRVVVVDQGGRKVRAHPAYPTLAAGARDRLRVVEQDNFGGAGGFTRCLLEALGTAGATHVLLMDDDAAVEPESLLRAAAFLTLARGDLAVGGHMLDLLRPRELVEAGSRCRPELVAIEPPVRHRVDRPGGLEPFLDVRHGDYNGWWFFALPLALLGRVGLPLPLFLRGDDTEFGYRLLRSGVPTVALPGVGVWHEPFEPKGRGHYPYYETRNLLAVGALHFPPPPAGVIARRFLSRLLEELLAYDYYEAWLLCEAAADYLRGPETLRAPPGAAHRRLLTAREEMTAGTLARAGGLPTVTPPPPPPGRLARRARLLGHLVRNLVRPSPPPAARPRHAIPGADERWYGVAGADVVAVDDAHRPDLVVLRRSRGRFVRLLGRGLWLALRLLGSYRRAVRRWRQGYPALTTRPFWREHLSKGSGG